MQQSGGATTSGKILDPRTGQGSSVAQKVVEVLEVFFLCVDRIWNINLEGREMAYRAQKVQKVMVQPIVS